VVLSGGNKADVLAAWATRLPGTKFALFACLHHHLSSEMAGWSAAKQRRRIRAWRSIAGRSRGLITVSRGLADDFVRVTGCPAEKLRVIYNPIVHPGLDARVAEPADHPWLAPGEPPVLLGVGRLTAQKDFANLVEAFARVRAERRCRLLIIGEGELKGELERQIRDLGIGDDVDLAGFQANPYPFMKAARLLVLSSRWEGFGNVLVEALYCATPIVSTDCPHGPREVLADGRYGRLVPVADPEGLAGAVIEALDEQPDRQALVARAREFSVATIGNRYLAVLGLDP
jgi:glycosyltransferase involved in cell wall biosynthesis